MFKLYPYAGSVWKGAVGNLKAGRTHEGTSASLEERTKSWWLDERAGLYEAFSVLYVFSIGEARNRAIFNNSWTPPDITISLLMSKVQETEKGRGHYQNKNN